jgi:hypothetical protein
MFVALFVINLAAIAAADEMPLVVTSGTISWVGCCAGSFSFAGDNITVLGGLSSGVPPPETLFNRAAGVTLTSTNRWVGSDIRGGTGTAAVVNGTTYEPVFLAGDIALTTGPILIPTTGEQSLTVQAPFSFAPGANLQIFNRPAVNLGPADALFHFGLFGSGTATIAFARDPGLPGYSARAVVWQFGSDQPGTAPEPATLVLVGAGVAGLLTARKRRRA